jgi:putative DNA primase/helicase
MNEFAVKDVPESFRETVKARYGQGVRMSSARGDGAYRGDVLVGEAFVAQRLGLDSVVFHQRSSLEFKNERLRGLDTAGSLTDQHIEVNYKNSKNNGGKAEVWAFDAEKSRFTGVVREMMKVAPEGYQPMIEAVGVRAWDSVVQARSGRAQDAGRMVLPPRAEQSPASSERTNASIKAAAVDGEKTAAATHSKKQKER